MAVIQLYDRDNKTWVPAQDSDVTDMVGSGKFGLQSGIDIPVTFSDGTMGTVPSDKFEEGVFNKQVRFQTQDDLKAYDKEQQEAINQKIYGNGEDTTVGAFSQGFARGIVPGADLLMEGMGVLSGHADDVKEGLKQTKERHPVAETLGNITGMVSNPILSKVGSAVGAVGEGLAGTALERLGSATVQGIGSKVAGGMLEGAFYGLPQGISEASLGDPQDVARNLAAGPAMGALFGGAFGSAFAATKAAAPFFKSAINRASDAGEELVSSVLQKGTKAAINVVPSIAAQKEFQEMAGDLAGHPEIIAAYEKYGKDGVKKILDMLPGMQDQLEDKASGLKKDLDKFIEGQPAKIKAQVEADFGASTGDLGDVMQSSLARLEANKYSIYSEMTADTSPSTLFDGSSGIYAETTKTIKALELTKDPKARAVARTLQTRLDGEMSAKGTHLVDGEFTPGSRTEGSDSILTRELGERARLGMENDKLPSAAKDILNEYHDNMRYLVRENSKFGESVSKLDDMSDAFNKFREFATSAIDNQNVKVKNGVIRSILTDPRRSRDYDTLLSSLSEFMPEFQAYREAGTNAVQKMNSLREASAKFEQMRNGSLDRGLTLDNIQELFDSFGKPQNIGDTIIKLQQAQSQLATQDSGPVSKYVRLAKYFGNEISPEIEKLKPFENQFSFLDKLRDSGKNNDSLSGVAARVAVGRVARKLGRYIGGPVVGEAVGVAAQTAMNGGINTYNTLKTLYNLDRAQRASFKMASTAISRTVDAMTGATAGKLSSITAGAVGEKYLKEKPRTITEARKDFKDRSDYLNKITTDPQFLTNEAQSRISGLEHTPSVGAALASHFANTAFYLANALPKDPLAGTGIPFHESGWQPSDSDLASYERRVSTAENPARAILDFGKGKISSEALQTLGALHPDMLGRLQKGLNDAIMTGNIKLSYPQRLNIGQILGVRADSSLDPQFVMAMQANHSSQGPGAPSKSPQGPNSGGLRPARLNINTDSHATDTTRVTYGH